MYNSFDKDYNKFDVTTYARRESLDGTAQYRARHGGRSKSQGEQDAEILHEDFKKFTNAVKDTAVTAKHKIEDKLHQLKERISSHDKE